MKIHYKQIEINKGERASRIHVISQLAKGLENLFEIVKDEEASNEEKMFGCDKKIISTGDYVFKLTIEKVIPKEEKL